MELLGKFLTAVIALPSILQSIFQLVTLLEKTFGPNWPVRVKEMQDACAKMEKATTDDEKDKARIDVINAFYSKS